jgi:hypothetical protein
MYLNSIQESAISLLQNSLDSGTPVAQSDPDLQRIQLTARFSRQNAAAGEMFVGKAAPDSEVYLSQNIGAGASFSSLSKSILSSLPREITPEFKQHLATLDALAKAGDNATEEQVRDALLAYKAMGKTLKIAIARPLIDYGIRTGLAEVPYVGPFSGTIANIAADPLAKMVVECGDKYAGLRQKLINKALQAMGREPIVTEQQDLFMTKLLSKFAGGILNEINAREAGGTLRADHALDTQVAAAGVGAAAYAK